jgi:hypothetical protein
MNDDALRAMVRDAVARRLGGAAPADTPQFPAAIPVAWDMSHARYTLPASDGPCLIEPGVPCNHCGYCESHGH